MSGFVKAIINCSILTGLTEAILRRTWNRLILAAAKWQSRRYLVLEIDFCIFGNVERLAEQYIVYIFTTNTYECTCQNRVQT